MIRDKIIFDLKKALKKAGFSGVEPSLEHPVNEANGDYASNIAMVLAKQQKIKEGNFLENIEWILKTVKKNNYNNYQEPLPVGCFSEEVRKKIKAKNSLVYLKPKVYAKVNGWLEGHGGHTEIKKAYWYLLPLFLYRPSKLLYDRRSESVFHFVIDLEGSLDIVVDLFYWGQDYAQVSSIYFTRDSYLKNFEEIVLDGGTAVPSYLSGPLLSGLGAGSRLSSLHQNQIFYNKIQETCQADLLHYNEEKLTPLQLAQKIAANFPATDYLEKVVAVAPGFINFYLKEEFLQEQLREILTQKEEFGKGQIFAGKKVSVEYTDPNPFKEFHVGHLYSNFIGESIALMLEFSGAEVWRGDFYGDVGMHVAKSVWGLIHELEEKKIDLDVLEKLSLKERQEFLGKGYARGVKAYDADKKIEQEIRDINLLIYIAGQEILQKKKNWQPIINYKQYLKGNEDKLQEIRVVYEAGLRWSLEYFESIYKVLGTKFDGYYPESWVGEYGMKIVQKGLEMGVLEKIEEGTVIYRGEKDGLHTRVFVNKLGLPTYEAKDLGLAYAKYQDFPYDLSINVFGKEIDEYYKVVRAAMIRIDPDLGKKASHIAHGMVKVPEGKMSSRFGNVVTFEGLLAQAKDYALKIMTEAKIKNSEERETVAQTVALAAIRYALLKSNIGSDVIFDFKKSITFDGDSGPYLQYTYARTRSVITKSQSAVIPAKAGIQDKPQETWIPGQAGDDNLEEEELSLLRYLYQFPEIVEATGKNYSPNLICTYLFDLAKRYNLFYNKLPILKATKQQGDKATMSAEEVRNFRLSLTEATGQVIKNGLGLLGIKVLERM